MPILRSAHLLPHKVIIKEGINMLKSQEVRKLAPEMDPLRMGMGWKEEDLTKPQILIESTYGQSHPGSVHLLNLAQKASRGAYESGGKGALYFATDICDGMAQGTMASIIPCPRATSSPTLWKFTPTRQRLTAAFSSQAAINLCLRCSWLSAASTFRPCS